MIIFWFEDGDLICYQITSGELYDYFLVRMVT